MSTLVSFFNNLIVRILLAAFLSWFAVRAAAQGHSEQAIGLSLNKTSSIVFPVDIESVDRGSRDILAQKAKGAGNVLKLKAGKANFPETNLTVIASDGGLHYFTVRFDPHPDRYIVYAAADNASLLNASNRATAHLTEVNQAIVENNARVIVSHNTIAKVKSIRKNDMRLSLKGIYIEGDLTYFHFNIANRSNIPFDVDILRLFVRDKQKLKRTATQEVIETPIYVHGQVSRIDGKSNTDVVYILPKFTIPDAKVLVIQLMEKRGGRHLEMHIKNRPIVHARKIPAI